MTLEVEKTSGILSSNGLNKLTKFSLYSRFFFSLFDILDLRPNQQFSEKISKIKIFVKSNQFLFNILPHNAIKTYSVNDFTMGCHFYINNPSFSNLVFHSLLIKGILFQCMHLHSNHMSLDG